MEPLPRSRRVVRPGPRPQKPNQINRREQLEIAANSANLAQNLPSSAVNSLYFYIYSPEEICRLAVTIVTDDSTIPTTGSVNDPLMGTAESNTLCGTCANNTLYCSGHFGRIPLPVPVFYPRDDIRRLVIHILTSICQDCSALLLSPEQIENDRSLRGLRDFERITAIAKLSEKLVCGNDRVSCRQNPTYSAGESKTSKEIYSAYPGMSKTLVSLEKIELLLKNISDDDLGLLGFENGMRPSNFILRQLMVIPPRFRHSRVSPGLTGRTEDGITLSYVEIVKDVRAINAAIDENSRNDAINNLNFHIRTLMDDNQANNFRGEIKGIKKRINDKYFGVVRGAIHGKPVMFSGRSVIVPNPMLKFGQVAIPEAMAPFTTRPVTVTAQNRENLQELLKQGRVTIVRPGNGPRRGQELEATPNVRETYKLEIGDRVERWLQNGDYVILGRQPTLHKQSLMGAEVVLWPYLTIGLHMAVTTAYNSDFDGDEMNIHTVQTDEADNEVKNMMSIRNCIMNAQDNKVEMGVVYNGIIAARLLTQEDMVVSQEEMIQDYFPHLVNTDYGSLFERIIELQERGVAIRLDSGRVLFSAAFPADYNYRKEDVVITRGVLIEGVIRKNHIGIEPDTIIQDVLLRYGDLRASNLLTDIYFILNRWLDEHPLSVGYMDCVPPPELRSQIDRIKADALLQIKGLGDRNGENLDEVLRERQIEAEIQSLTQNISETVLRELPENNFLKMSIVSGTKGKGMEAARIISFGGQQRHQKVRLPLVLDRGSRCSPYYSKQETNPVARGLCWSSYIEGLEPFEFYAQQVNSAGDLITTGTKTPDTGSLARSLSRVMENVMLVNDGTVRDSAGMIVQFLYGEDGFNAEKMTTVKFARQTRNTFVNIHRLADQVSAHFGVLNTQPLSAPQPAIFAPAAQEGPDDEAMSDFEEGDE